MASHRQHTDYERAVFEYSGDLKAFLIKRLGNEADAEDALQEILYNLFRTAGDDLSGISNLPAWLYRSARNLLSNLGRRENPIFLDDSEFMLSLLTDETESQESALLRQMFWSELEAALSELPMEQRQIWEMTELDGIPVKEIARITGTPQATLLSRKHYAVKHLRKRLQQLYNDIINQ